MFFQRIILSLLLFIPLAVSAAKLSYYLPAEHNYHADITKPKEVLGFGIGERHLRHDQLIDYLSTVAAESERVQLDEIGRTYQQRKQLLLTISSPDNLANLDQILAKRRDNPSATDLPIVVWLGYSVHGDEISGSHASLAIAYHLAASQSEEVTQMLNDVIVVIEPSINPDGMDRFTSWVNTYRSAVDNSDPYHMEHHQHWPSGRTNHYWFDLNRDWLLLSQQESVNRLTHYHAYQPNVLGDFHEMGAHTTYFFQPGVPSRTNPITPLKNIELTQKIAEFHAKALDVEQRLYYSEENFDDFYYGKGSTYPDANGAIGILFEQASSRGYQQETINGLLTFEFGIKNHVLTSLSTLEGSWKLKNELAVYRGEFFKNAEKLAKKEKISGYLVHEPNDKTRLNLFLSKLKQHQIEVFPLTDDFRLSNNVYSAADSYYVPLAQKQYRVIKALFSQQTEFKDNTFYDVSGWTLPLAMNIEFKGIERTWGLKLASQTWQPEAQQASIVDKSAYAFAIEWHDYYAPRLLNQLLANNVQVKVATKAFSSVVNGELKDFAPGSLVVASGFQRNSAWFDVVEQLSREQLVTFHPIATGLTPTGIDLGSNSLRLIEPPKLLLVGGKGVSQYEAGEMRYFLEQEMAMPVSVIEMPRLSKVDLASYTHIIMVDGNYDGVSKPLLTKIERWVRDGGVIYGQKRAAQWLSTKEVLKTSFASKKQLNQLFDTQGLTYADKEALAARKRIAGTIFEANIDVSHPLAYGFRLPTLPVFKNSALIMDKPKIDFATVASFSESPLLSGYTDQTLVNRLAHNASIVAHNVGRGRVIATTENLVFRGYWQGTAKVMANAIFFAKAFSTPVKN